MQFRNTVGTMVSLLALTIAATAAAEAPAVVPLQGALTASSGSPVTGTHSLTVSLYTQETGGTAVFAETHDAVHVDDGGFSLYLGSVDDALDLSLFEERTDLWLEVIIDGTEIVQPRIRLATVPYAGYASYAGHATIASKLDCSNCVTLGALGSDVIGAFADVSHTHDWTDLQGLPAGFADGTDDDTTYTAGTGLRLTGTVFAIATNGIGSAQIADGAITSDDIADGAITLSALGDDVMATFADVAHTHDWTDLQGVPAGFADGTDNDTTYTAGTGLTLTGTVFYPDTNVLQARVTGTCAAGSSIRAIAANGMVTCQIDNNNGTTYSAGSGLALTGTTFSIANAGVTSANIADGTIATADIVASGIAPNRVAGVAAVLNGADDQSFNKGTLYIDAHNGRVGVNSVAPDVALTVDGEGRFTGTVRALSFVSTSDRDAKTAFVTVNPRSILDRLARIDVSRWSYKAEPGVTHMGPVAQDFHAAFGLGNGNKTIATVDADGVALAAIQGLNQLVEQQAKRIAVLEAHDGACRSSGDTRLEDVLERLDRLERENVNLRARPSAALSGFGAAGALGALGLLVMVPRRRGHARKDRGEC